MQGVVRWFDRKKGFGFIVTNEGREVFVHYKHIEMPGYRVLDVGCKVEFDIGSDDKGDCAINVRPLATENDEQTSPT
ncbi:MAG: cold shock domain-containing protein [Candidatus Brocadiia bacterium]